MLRLTLIIVRVGQTTSAAPCMPTISTLRGRIRLRIAEASAYTLPCRLGVPIHLSFHSSLLAFLAAVAAPCFGSCRRFYYIRHPAPRCIGLNLHKCPSGRLSLMCKDRPGPSGPARRLVRPRYQDLRLGHVTTRRLMPIGRQRSRDVPVFVGLLVSGFHALLVLGTTRARVGVPLCERAPA